MPGKPSVPRPRHGTRSRCRRASGACRRVRSRRSPRESRLRPARPPTSAPGYWPARRSRRACCRSSPPSLGCSTTAACPVLGAVAARRGSHLARRSRARCPDSSAAPIGTAARSACSWSSRTTRRIGRRRTRARRRCGKAWAAPAKPARMGSRRAPARRSGRHHLDSRRRMRAARSGAADWREVRSYVLARARPDCRDALAAALDGRAAATEPIPRRRSRCRQQRRRDRRRRRAGSIPRRLGSRSAALSRAPAVRGCAAVLRTPATWRGARRTAPLNRRRRRGSPSHPDRGASRRAPSGDR